MIGVGFVPKPYGWLDFERFRCRAHLSETTGVADSTFQVWRFMPIY
jgi:hypothetical protein